MRVRMTFVSPQYENNLNERYFSVCLVRCLGARYSRKRNDIPKKIKNVQSKSEMNLMISKRFAMFWSLSLMVKYPVMPPNMLYTKAITYQNLVDFVVGEDEI